MGGCVRLKMFADTSSWSGGMAWYGTVRYGLPLQKRRPERPQQPVPKHAYGGWVCLVGLNCSLFVGWRDWMHTRRQAGRQVGLFCLFPSAGGLDLRRVLLRPRRGSADGRQHGQQGSPARLEVVVVEICRIHFRSVANRNTNIEYPWPKPSLQRWASSWHAQSDP